MAFIDQKELFEKTDGGRLVIEQYLPQSIESFRNHMRKFKYRLAEKTASASLKQMPDGVWIVTDFGNVNDKGKAPSYNAIQVVMDMEGLEFGAAINLIAAQFNIVGEDKKSEIFKPDIRRRDAEKEEVDGTWYFKTKPFTAKEIQIILPPKVWEYLVSIVRRDTEAEKQEARIVKEVVTVFNRYAFYSVESYTVIKDRKAIEIRSTDIYPIFMFDEKDWKKLYQPRSVDAGRRFMYYNEANRGEKPKSDFMFGYHVAKHYFDELIQIEQDDAEIDDVIPEGVGKAKSFKKMKGAQKLKNIFLCSGGSDGLTLAVIGQCFKNEEQSAENFYPVWMNSETALLREDTFKNLQRLAETVYNIPDIDATGKKAAHRIALEYLELKTVYLPEELKTKVDSFRRKPMKDLRDYFRYYKPWDFFTLIRTAYPYRFWDAKPPTDKNPKWSYQVNNEHLYNFLEKCGFCRYETKAEKEGYVFIKIEGDQVFEIKPVDIRDFIKNFLRARMPDTELINTFHRTTQLSESSLSNLPYKNEIDFTDHDKNTQWFFFDNVSCEITKDEIKDHKPGASGKYVWREEVVPHKVKVLPSMFEIKYDAEKEFWDIDIKNNDCLVFRYLTNASRMFWRQELEERLEGIPKNEQEQYKAAYKFTKDDEKLMQGKPETEWEEYRIKHKFSIDGPLLTATEVQEQKHNLVNKIFTIGHILHRHKQESKGWAPWSTDAKNGDSEDANGGTGKSLIWTLISRFIKYKPLKGMDTAIVDDKHIYHTVTEHTDLIFVNDCNRYLKVNYFYSDITEDMMVNPKFGAPYTIGYQHSPKFVFTSNFPPFNVTAALERRLIYSLYSDYYHFNQHEEYREERTVRHDFGKDLGSGFTEYEWNLFFNFLMQCVKFYIGQTEKINAPMTNVTLRNMKNEMGEVFEQWADVYFSKDSDAPKIDRKIIKEDAFEEFNTKNRPKNYTIHRFKKNLEAWCRYNGYELNPKEVCNSKSKNGKPRIIDNITELEYGGVEKRIAKEMLYIKTKEVSEGDLSAPNKKVAAQQTTETKEDECPI